MYDTMNMIDNEYNSRLIDHRVFNSYYSLNLPMRELTEDDFHFISTEANYRQIVEVIKSGKYDLHGFLLCIKEKIDLFSNNCAMNIFRALKSCYGLIVFLDKIDKDIVNELCTLLLCKIDNNNVCELMKTFFSEDDDYGQEILLTDLLLSEEQYNNKMNEFEIQKYISFFSGNSIDELENACGNTNFFDHILSYEYDTIMKLIYLWENISPENLFSSIKSEMNKKHNTLKLVASRIYLTNMCNQFNGEDKIYVDWEILSKYGNIDELYLNILNDSQNRIRKMDVKTQTYIVAFLMLVKKCNKKYDLLENSIPVVIVNEEIEKNYKSQI